MFIALAFLIALSIVPTCSHISTLYNRRGTTRRTIWNRDKIETEEMEIYVMPESIDGGLRENEFK